MEIIPAIYIQKGQCVSWYKGYDNEQKKIYPQSPLNIARFFAGESAKKLQIIDLDGSTQGTIINHKIITRIRKEVQLEIQVGGGIRTTAEIKELFDLGINRIILGYSAFPIIRTTLKKYGPDKILAGIKAKDEIVKTDHKLGKPVSIFNYAEDLIKIGVKNIIYKNLETEGTLYPQYDEAERLKLLTKVNIYLSGGIGQMKDLEILQKVGLKGVIISKAFMEGKLDLMKCLLKYTM